MKKQDPLDEMLSLEAAAAEVQRDVSTLQKHIATGKLHAVQVSHPLSPDKWQWGLNRGDLLKFYAEVRRGRPQDESPTDAALAMRRSRDRKRQAEATADDPPTDHPTHNEAPTVSE